jgi:hypothetical protein
MPTPDIEPALTVVQLLRVVQKERFVQRLAELAPRDDRRPEGEAGNAMPVHPRRPSDLSGGAAAAVDFED